MSNNSGGSDNPSDSTNKGIVIADMANYKAVVCYDRNENMICDLGEPSATVAEDGSYIIENDKDLDISNVAVVLVNRQNIQY